MALSLTVIGNAGGAGGPFVAQCSAGLQSTVTAILGESSATPDYVVRRKFAQKIDGSVAQFAPLLAVAIASQVQSANPAKYSDLTAVQDVDVTNALSAIFTQQAYANVFPS